MKLEDITIPQESINWQSCLQHWSWLLKKCPEFNILLVTKFGELFVTNDNGEVWFLSTSNGSYEKVAKSKDELSILLSDEENIEYYFMPNILYLLNKAGAILKDSECYGFHIPCVFKESTFEANNFKVIKIENYLIALGDMLGKLQNTNDGESVKFIPVA